MGRNFQGVQLNSAYFGIIIGVVVILHGAIPSMCKMATYNDHSIWNALTLEPMGSTVFGMLQTLIKALRPCLQDFSSVFQFL